VNWQIDLKYFYERYLKFWKQLEKVKYQPYYTGKWLWNDTIVLTSEWENNESARPNKKVWEKSEVAKEFEIYLCMLCEILKVIGEHEILTVEEGL
jgi:hypothetical protein